ncbi:MAG TPA: zf-HC2 domain-containing protein [Rhizomicrobium sp.]
MSCDHILTTQSYLDGQLDGEESNAAERHLQTCAECQNFAARTADLSDSLRQATRHQAPELLRARVRAALKREAAPTKVRAFWWGAASGGGVSALAAALALFLFLPPSAASLAEAIADAHARALTSGHTIMVASSNHHVVKPWLAAHAGISPPAADFAAQGFVLTGGRIDTIAGVQAAVSVYAHGNHELDLFTWVDKSGALPQATTVRGFRTAFWKEGDLNFAAVSDMDEAAFQKFIALARE